MRGVGVQGFLQGHHLPGRPRHLGGLGGPAGRGLLCCPSGPTDKDPARQPHKGAQCWLSPSPTGPPGLPGPKPHPPGSHGRQGPRGGLAGPAPPERQRESISPAPPPLGGWAGTRTGPQAIWPSCWGGGILGAAEVAEVRPWDPMHQLDLAPGTNSPVALGTKAGGIIAGSVEEPEVGLLPRPGAGCWASAPSARVSRTGQLGPSHHHVPTFTDSALAYL